MPSSLIIVALAVAWLVVLVPMVARKRQEVAETGDDALASRVVRGARGELADREEEGMPEPTANDEDAYDDYASHEDQYDDEVGRTREEAAEAEEAEYADDDYAEPPPRDHRDHRDPREDSAGRYRPGRGGFDPQAAELVARAKYAYRQRIVLALLATVIISAVVAGVVWSTLFWLTGAAAAGLVGYLGYLRRQVRIEEDIRQRRMARLAGARSAERRRERDDLLDVEYDRGLERDFEAEYAAGYDAEYEYELADDGPMPLAGVERKPRPSPRTPRRNTVVVDVDDEDPAFHELAVPDHPTYRRAAGE
ncbi:MAG: divisome protein SepX/GlpR, partial [Thermocrispum sp.]